MPYIGRTTSICILDNSVYNNHWLTSVNEIVLTFSYISEKIIALLTQLCTQSKTPSNLNKITILTKIQFAFEPAFVGFWKPESHSASCEVKMAITLNG
jgi:hypothetical protein